ncbi:hypothetical protein APHNP_0318 [Anaplasma phagocytophilum str. ApNP]|uniref:Uncharacterized protein n=2 Tax=Anaplasma phagocytophilum TaxID=948 RepID=A0A0F3NHF3_ANAPH|nr:hypothetical protein APHMUC_0537 [Anaplasma phagocytophilum str. ApMUC09]KJV67470.1 hypothetical protein APHNP_0318 [Anaplasma phagocytophilum str. ApNP]SCV63541.1 hypothetical protein ANAPH2_00668 [Anaplasma phagocytophilum]
MAENIRRVLCFKIVFSKLSSGGLRSNRKVFHSSTHLLKRTAL